MKCVPPFYNLKNYESYKKKYSKFFFVEKNDVGLYSYLYNYVIKFIARGCA